MPDIDNSNLSVVQRRGYFFFIQNHDAIIAVYNLKAGRCINSNLK